MRALVQRVSEAHVTVEGSIVAEISSGLLVLLAIQDSDTEKEAEKLASKVTRLRIFADETGRMNVSALNLRKQLLVVSQFTLYGDTASGNRPSYAKAASPEKAQPIYEYFVEQCRATQLTVRTGVFRAHMLVSSINDGPVSLLCECDTPLLGDL